jgi:signal transduction histidine kinase
MNLASKESEARSRELADAWEQQAATSEILRVMSLSRSDALPVFETIVRKAVALCGSLFANVFRFDGELLHYVASHNTGLSYVELLQSKYPMRPDSSQVSGRVILSRSIVRLEDARADRDYDQRFPSAMGWRRMLGVPMLRDGKPLGVIVVGWAESGPVPKAQEELLQTFADQAVIAIENVRLFNELEARNRELTEALEQQTATGEILRVISQSPTDVQPVFDTIAEAAMKLCGATSANVFTFDGKLLHAAAIHIVSPGGVEAIRRIFPRPPDRGTAASRAVRIRGVVAIEDVLDDPDYEWNEAPRWGFRSALGVPLMREGTPIGALALGRPEPGPFPKKQIALLQTFADQAVIAIENVRLFHELEAKSRQLEIASRHKSAFLANMSHELRTPLNAIIGFTRIVMRQSRAQLDLKQYENLEKILASGQHLLSLINAILDLAKVEAGHIEITAGDVQLAPILERCMRTVEPLVKDGVKLVKAFGSALPTMFVDEEKLRQIMINLLSNAAKFTESGTIEVRAREEQGSIEIAVVDTGIGIPPDKLDLIFEQFEQADASSTREYGGTGLGLTIARRLARLMGGDIRAESEPSAGSTFALTLPVRYGSLRV